MPSLSEHERKGGGRDVYACFEGDAVKKGRKDGFYAESTRKRGRQVEAGKKK